MILKYFGSLPSYHRGDNWNNVYPKFRKGVTNVTVLKGTEPQGMVGIVMSEDLIWTPKNLLELSMLKEILSIKLIEVIREQMSGAYSPQIMLNPDHYPHSSYQLGVLFGCSPTNADKLSKAVFGEMKKIRKSGPTAVDLEKAQETLIRTRETDLEKNNFWLTKIESIYFDGTDPGSVLDFKDRVKAVTISDLQQAANIYFRPDHYVRVVLKPEKK
jgi:zinc protease